MEWVFWISVAFIAYTIAGYPLMLVVVARLRNRVHRRSAIQPSVSIIVPVHNEALTLHKKITNTLELDYPAEKLEIIFVSDGSTDDSVSMIRSFANRGIKLVELEEPKGKHFAQMMARDAASGEILVFTDAGVLLDRDSLHKLVANFADPTVGCVSSEDRIITSHGSSGEGTYVGLEMRLRRLETLAGSVVSASGSYFAARSSLCDLWHPEQSSDFFVPLHAAERHLRSIVDPECIGYYGVTRKGKAEFHRKVRTIVHGLHVAFFHRQLLNPFKYPVFAWQLISHKLFRWMLPFGMVGVLLSSLFLADQGTFYRLIMAMQVSFYAGGALVLGWKRLQNVNPLRMLGFVVLSVGAILMAWVKYCSGERFASWQPTRRG